MNLNEKTPSSRILRAARRYSFILLVISVIIQVFMWDLLNILCAIIIMLISWPTFYIILRPGIFSSAVLPAFVVLSFNISILSGPLIFQSIAFTPVIYNLEVPLTTFFFSSLYQLILLIVLILFAKTQVLKRLSRTINSLILKPSGLMKVPTYIQFWLMGFIGLTALAWYSTLSFSGGLEYGDSWGKFFSGFTFLAYAPFLIPFTNQMSLQEHKFPVIQAYLLIIYFFILLIVSVALNSRSAFATGIATIAFVFFIFVLLGQIIITNKIKKRIFIMLFTLLIMLPQLSDLATAMIIARSDRNDISSFKMIEKTFEIFQDKEKLKDRQKIDMIIANGTDYGEYYLTNPFLARFVNLKFFDNMFSLENVMQGRYSEKIRTVSMDKIVALLPTPILRLLDIKLDKNQLAFSMGDYLLYLEGKSFLGGYKVGSSVVHGFSMFGWFVYIIIIPIYLFLFVLLQAWTTKVEGVVLMSPLIMLILMKFYFISHNDSLLEPIYIIFRGVPQTILIYLIALYLTRFMSFGLISNKRV